MKKAALYIRVSTSHQIDKDSLPFQRQELINYSKYILGIDDYEIFEDAGYSAKNTDRPRYQNMMSRVRTKEFSHILVYKIDRISRNLRDFSAMYDEIKECGTTFISKNEQFDTSSAMGEAMLKIILVFAELERKLTGERVFSVMLSRAEKGLWNGATVPLGYVWSPEEKFPVMDESEAQIVRYVYDLYEKLASTGEVAYRLNDESIKTKRGGKWTAKTVGDILHNPFYIGTYRYNTKTSGTRRWKDKKEWVVVEDNHPGIISPEQHYKVNEMLAANYSGNGNFQRSSINTHIFSKILVCGKCGSNFTSGLDTPRKDGYRPSRYTCYSNHYNQNIANCNNFVSDITILPFVLNYISNFINLQEKITQTHSLRDIERMLLRGNSFIDVVGIDRSGLEATYLSFSAGFPNEPFEVEKNLTVSPGLELENLQKEKQKYEKALTRLDDLYLFAEETMAEKDFLFKKRDIVQHIEQINSSISDYYKRTTDKDLNIDTSFLTNAGTFLMAQELTGKRTLDFKELLAAVDNTQIKEFISAIIDKIEIVDKKISSITFRNGVIHRFIYKPKEEQQPRTRDKLFYRNYEPIIIDYLKENGSVNRKEVEEITGMTRTGAGSIIREFEGRGLLERKGNSIAIRYYLAEEKPAL